MGIWGSVKRKAEQTKMQANILLAKRNIEKRKKKFGKEFYNILTNDKQKLLGGTVSAGSLSVFKKNGKEDPLKDAFEKCHEDIRGMKARMDELQRKIDVMEVKGSHTMPDGTMGQKVNKTGKMISDTGISTKIQAQMALIDREMLIRKENFGLEAYDMVKSTEDKSKKGIKGNISKALVSLSEQEKEIQKVVDTAKNDVEVLEGKIKSMERQISFLSDPSETQALADN